MKVSIREAVNIYNKDHVTPSGGKAYFSWDCDNGWSIKELNIFQRFLRWCFGMYSSTHLKNVQREYKNLTDQINLDEVNRSQALCRAYLSSLYLIDGENTNQSVLNKMNKGELRLNDVDLHRLDRLSSLPDKELVSTSNSIRTSCAKICSFFGSHMESLQYYNTAYDASCKAKDLLSKDLSRYESRRFLQYDFPI